MVKIINGEIVDDHDPRARTLFQPQYIAQQQQLQQQQQQQAAHFSLHDPDASYGSPYGYPPPYAYYPPQYAYQHAPPSTSAYHEYMHHSALAAYDEQSMISAQQPPPPAATPPPSTSASHLSAPPPSPLHLTSPSLSSRRLSFSSTSSSSVPASSSPSLTHRRLSFSSSMVPPHLSSSSSASSAALPPPHPSPPSSSLYPRRSPSSYNLFGLPSVMISDIPVKPHVYLLAGLLLYFIGPPVLVPLLASFFFYRWHLNKEAEKKEHERLQAKFSVFRDAKTRPREQQRTIHSLRDRAS